MRIVVILQAAGFSGLISGFEDPLCFACVFLQARTSLSNPTPNAPPSGALQGLGSYFPGLVLK